MNNNEKKRSGNNAKEPKSKGVTDLFHLFAQKMSLLMGHPVAFLIALVIIAVWAVTGPVAGFSDTWQLIINTGTTIVTFLMVFLIQNTQNRDNKALQLKLDELIHALKGARDSLVDLEDLSDEELDRLQKEFQKVRTRQAGTGRKPEEE